MVLVYSLSYQKLVVPVFVVNCSRIVFLPKYCSREQYTFLFRIIPSLRNCCLIPDQYFVLFFLVVCPDASSFSVLFL